VRGKTDKAITILRADGASFLYYMTSDLDVAEAPRDRTCEHMQYEPPSPKGKKKKRWKVFAFLHCLDLLFRVGFLQPMSLRAAPFLLLCKSSLKSIQF
jgi:hypothetical protein